MPLQILLPITHCHVKYSFIIIVVKLNSTYCMKLPSVTISRKSWKEVLWMMNTLLVRSYKRSNRNIAENLMQEYILKNCLKKMFTNLQTGSIHQQHKCTVSKCTLEETYCLTLASIHLKFPGCKLAPSILIVISLEY